MEASRDEQRSDADTQSRVVEYKTLYEQTLRQYLALRCQTDISEVEARVQAAYKERDDTRARINVTIIERQREALDNYHVLFENMQRRLTAFETGDYDTTIDTESGAGRLLISQTQ